MCILDFFKYRLLMVGKIKVCLIFLSLGVVFFLFFYFSLARRDSLSSFFCCLLRIIFLCFLCVLVGLLVSHDPLFYSGHSLDTRRSLIVEAVYAEFYVS